MKQTRSLALGPAFRTGLQIRETVLILGISLVLPFLVHSFPTEASIPLGARLLPIFYAPFVAVLFFRFHVGLIAGILAPMVNYLITGFPEWQQVALLSFELGAFATCTHLLIRHKKIQWVLAPMAFIFAKVFSTSLICYFPMLKAGMLPTQYFEMTISIAWAGIIMLWIINVLAIKLRQQDN